MDLEICKFTKKRFINEKDIAKYKLAFCLFRCIMSSPQNQKKLHTFVVSKW